MGQGFAPAMRFGAGWSARKASERPGAYRVEEARSALIVVRFADGSATRRLRAESPTLELALDEP
jgi:hypothetical protein